MSQLAIDPAAPGSDRPDATNSGSETFAPAPLKGRRACMVAYTFYDQDNRVRRYAETLARQGCEVDVLALSPAKQANKIDFLNGVRVMRLQRRTANERSRFLMLAKIAFFFLRSMCILIREQRKRPYDLVHVHSIPDFEVFAAWYPKLTGSRIILDIHDIVPEYYCSKFGIAFGSPTVKLLLAIERLSTVFSDHVIIANHVWEQRLESRSVKASKLTTILNFPDTQIFQRRGRTRNDGKFIIVYPGSLNYHQGLDLAIRAFARIMHRVPRAEFHIYGAGEQLSSLRALIQTLGVKDRVFLRNLIPLEQVASVVENADLGVVPKRKSGFGNEAFSTKTLEFMSLGVPVIVPDTMIDTHYFNDSVVRFFRAEDEISLSESILALALDSQERERLARNASEFVKSYIWSANENLYLDIVNGLLNERKRSAPTAP